MFIAQNTQIAYKNQKKDIIKAVKFGLNDAKKIERKTQNLELIENRKLTIGRFI